jgi:hypothetical protein
MPDGIKRRLTKCAGCEHPFDRAHPAVHCCEFRETGFPWDMEQNHVRARACGVQYHAGCVRVGEPFRTRLADSKGLVLLHQAPLPHYICEACQVRRELGRELLKTQADVALLMLERMRQIDTLNNWQRDTLKKYGPLLKFLLRFERQFGVQILKKSRLSQPPRTPAIPLMWSELYYSLRNTKGKDGVLHRIGLGTIRQIRSAAGMFYTLDMQAAYPQRVIRDSHRRSLVFSRVSPCDEPIMTFATEGLARRLGSEVSKSWALAHVHIAYMDTYLNTAFNNATSLVQQHELACAGTVNLLAYLGWLRGGEVFGSAEEDLKVVLPADGPSRNLPPGIGAVEYRLKPETKSDQTVAADIVIAFETLSGLGLGKWVTRLLKFTSFNGTSLFSTPKKPKWDSRYFRLNFAIPILERMRSDGEPTLRAFSDKPGNRLQDKITSLHSWRRGGRSRVSRPPRHNEPKSPGSRVATETEIYEHGRWSTKPGSEAMPKRYNQWDLSERITVTLHCM